MVGSASGEDVHMILRIFVALNPTLGDLKDDLRSAIRQREQENVDILRVVSISLTERRVSRAAGLPSMSTL